MMPSRYRTLCVLLLTLLPAMAASSGDVVLTINPFERPLVTSSKDEVPDAAMVEAPQVTLELRGTMAAGEHSLANIGGEILAIGQEISGYRLVAVHQRHVVLQKNDIQRTLLIDKDMEEAE